MKLTSTVAAATRPHDIHGLLSLYCSLICSAKSYSKDSTGLMNCQYLIDIYSCFVYDLFLFLRMSHYDSLVPVRWQTPGEADAPYHKSVAASFYLRSRNNLIYLQQSFMFEWHLQCSPVFFIDCLLLSERSLISGIT